MKEHSLFSDGLSALNSIGSACADALNSTGKACAEVFDTAKTPTTVVVYKPEFSQSPEQPFTVSQSFQSIKNDLASNFFTARRYFDMFAFYFHNKDVGAILKDDKNEPIMTRYIKSCKRAFIYTMNECIQKNPMLLNDMQIKVQKMVDEEGFSKGYASNFQFLDFFAGIAVRDHYLSFFKPIHSKGVFSSCSEAVFSNFLSLSARIQIICDLSIVPFKTWDFFLNNPKLQRLQEVVKLDLSSNRFSIFGNGDSDEGWKQANANVGILPSPHAEEYFIKCNQLEFDLSSSVVEKHLLEAMQCIDWDTIDDADKADLFDCDHFFDGFQRLVNQTPKTLTDLILIKPWSRIFAQRRLCLQNFYPDDTSLLAHFDLECRQALDHARTQILPIVTEYLTVIKSLQGDVMARIFDATWDARYSPERADKTAQAFALRYQHDLLMNDDTSGGFKANQYHDLDMRSVDLEESLYLFNQCGKEASNHHVLTIESLLQDNGLSLLRRHYLRKSRVMHPDRSHDGAVFCWMNNLYNRIKDCISRANLQSLKHCPRSQDDHHQL